MMQCVYILALGFRVFLGAGLPQTEWLYVKIHLVEFVVI